MSRRRNKKKRQENCHFSEGETPHFNAPEKDYFLGFKRKNYNELWRWDDLTDVDFSTWKPENSNHKYGNN
jgi:hypothetical protein